jgi:hypothetical protein
VSSAFITNGSMAEFPIIAGTCSSMTVRSLSIRTTVGQAAPPNLVGMLWRCAGLLWRLSGGRLLAIYKDWATIAGTDGTPRVFHRRPSTKNVTLPWLPR